MNLISNLERAMMVAEKCHSNQDYDIYPYMYHIKMTLRIAQKLGYDESIQIGCVLHDSLEDDSLSYNKIKKAFGEEVAEIVYAVSDGDGRTREEKKKNTYPKIRANWKATAVKICDRIANMTHSKQYTPDRFKKYIKEYPEFLKGINSDDHPIDVDKAWDMLDNLIYDENGDKRNG